MLFDGTLQRGKELPLVEALIQAGADLNFQRDREDGKKSDSPLIGAAGLGAEEVGLMLLDAGAKPELRGSFGETALHWAALLGEDRLAEKMIRGCRSERQGREVQVSTAGMGDLRDSPTDGDEPGDKRARCHAQWRPADDQNHSRGAQPRVHRPIIRKYPTRLSVGGSGRHGLEWSRQRDRVSSSRFSLREATGGSGSGRANVREILTRNGSQIPG